MPTLPNTALRGTLAALLCGASAAWAQTTYDYTSAEYGASAVAPYTATMQTTGWVRIDDAGLPSSSGIDLRARVLDWRISDGIVVYTPADSAVFSGNGYTDASGVLSMDTFSVMRPPGPHTAGQRIDSVHLFSAGDVNVRRNGLCDNVDAGSGLCNGLTGDETTVNFATSTAPDGGWRVRAAPVAVAPVPTLSQWGLLLTGVLVAGLGLRRRIG